MNTASSNQAAVFEGAKNVRDLGGLPTTTGRRTKPGVLFRADGLSRLSDKDVDTLGRLRIRTVIDLRFAEERERAPDRLPRQSPPRVHVRGMLPRGSLELFEAVNEHGADGARAAELMRRNYGRIPLEHADDFRDVMAQLLHAKHAPWLVHCTSGKDRTGIAIALILRAVDVEPGAIVDDYTLSNTEHQPVDVFGPAAREDAITAVMAAHPSYVQSTFEAIDDRFGSFDAYFRDALGFSEENRMTLAAHLLD